MVRVISAGAVGGLILLIWSIVFSAVGPVDAQVPLSGRAAASIATLREKVAGVGITLPFGPATASAAPQQAQSRPQPVQATLDYSAIAQSLAVACGAATLAAILMSWFGGSRRPFTERVLFAVMLGAFAGLAMSVPAGGWSEFSVHRTALFLGEVLVGWTLAGMVIAVMINPKPKKAKA